MEDDASCSDCVELVGVDYYAALGLDRSCNDEEIRKAFRRLALRLHPERVAAVQEIYPLDDDSQANAFAVVAEAYEVLRDPLRRAVFDQYGEKGLKNHLRGPDGCIKPYVFHGNPLQTYREFFGTENPYGDLLDHYGSPVPLEECPETKGKKKKDEPVIKALPLTLNEVFYGGVKKMKIQRLVLVGGDGDKETESATKMEEKILSVPIRPGMPAGTRIVFPEEGDQGPTKIPADIIFVTEDKPHETFKRDGKDLRMTWNLFLSDALTGTIITVHTIDERILRVPITSIISPDYVKVVPGEGLPSLSNPERRGDLLIGFKIEFPSYLSPSSKSFVHKAFQKSQEFDEDDDRMKSDASLNRRIHLGGKMYMRADRLPQICKEVDS